jgi:hypothetical protein
MSNRFGLEVTNTPDNTVGFDPAAQTFFFQSQQEDEHGRPKVWLGYRVQQYQRLVDLEAAIAGAYGLQQFQIDAPTRERLVSAAQRCYQQLYQQQHITRSQWSTLLNLIAQPA